MNSLDWEWELAYAWTRELSRLDEAAEAALLEDELGKFPMKEA